MEDLTIRQATELLEHWGAAHSATYAERDNLIRTAHAAGIGKSRIAQLMGVSRDTVNRILREPKGTP